jgi:hypothetical protein
MHFTLWAVSHVFTPDSTHCSCHFPCRTLSLVLTSIRAYRTRFVWLWLQFLIPAWSDKRLLRGYCFLLACNAAQSGRSVSMLRKELQSYAAERRSWSEGLFKSTALFEDWWIKKHKKNYEAQHRRAVSSISAPYWRGSGFKPRPLHQQLWETDRGIAQKYIKALSLPF